MVKLLEFFFQVLVTQTGRQRETERDRDTEKAEGEEEVEAA
jgi:hypothetical protein